MSLYSRCIRYFVIIVNLIVLALACLLIYVSIKPFNQDLDINSIYNSNNHNNNENPKLIHTYASLGCALLGLLIALLSLMGLYGAVRKSGTILVVYITIAILMILIFFIVILTSNNNSWTQTKELDKSLVNATVSVYNFLDSSDMKTKLIDKIQRSFSCCGVNSPEDWKEFSLRKIPKSCCFEPVESSLPVFQYCAESDYKQGCWTPLIEYLRTNSVFLKTFACILVVFCLACAYPTLHVIYTLTGVRKKSLQV